MDNNRRMPPPPPPIKNVQPSAGQGPQKRPEKKKTNWALIIVGLLVILAGVAGGIYLYLSQLQQPQVNTNQVADNVNQDEPQAGQDEHMAQGTTNAAVGESILGNNGVTYTLVSVHYTEPTEEAEAAENEEYIHCLVKIENSSNQKISYNIFYWTIEDEEGQVFTVNFEAMEDNESSLGSGELKLDESVEGTVSFMVPDSGNLILEAHDSHLNDVEASWLIER